jgi:PadR family transcriptional regulator PadR
LADERFNFELSDMCVIAILAGGDSYGYQINQELLDVMEMSESSLYPILKKFERQGTVEGYSREQGGRLRRYYRLTPQGLLTLEDAKVKYAALRQWLDMKFGNGEAADNEQG